MIMDSTLSSLSNRDWKMLHRAADIAKASTARHKHGALLYKGGKVLSVGINTNRNEHPSMEIIFDAYSEHAEVATIRGLGRPHVWHAKNATLYVARVNKNGEWAYSKPCGQCYARLEIWGIKRIVFTESESI